MKTPREIDNAASPHRIVDVEDIVRNPSDSKARRRLAEANRVDASCVWAIGAHMG